MAACAQCRQRKVRCQGGPSSCEACTRLGFECSLSAPVGPTLASENTSTVFRKRGARACDACRAQRSRCSGDMPSCFRCQQLDIPCNYTLSIRQHRARRRNRMSTTLAEDHLSQGYQGEANDIVNNTPTTEGEAVTSPVTSASDKLDGLLRCEKAVVRHHIDAYFEHIYPVPLFSFIHRAECLNQYSSGALAPALLLAICGVSSRFVQFNSRRDGASKSWVELAETMLIQCLGKTTLADIQTLMILALYRGYNNHNGKAFLYLGLAVRMAYSIKLHQEDSRLSFVEQECRRRLLWCMFTMDRLHAGGVPEYILLPVASMQVQLPCKEHYFEADVAVETPHLRAQEPLNSEVPISAFLMRLFDIRNRILQYTKQLLDTSTSPQVSLAQFRAFEEELKSVHAMLPAELLFSIRAFQLRAFSPERTTFIVFHVYYHHCHCELYRLLNPGYREALPQHVISATSPDLVAYAQSKCLEHVIAIGDIIASTHDLVEIGPYVTDVTCFVVSYQASCAILYACHRDSPAYTLSAKTARRYFIVFIQILEKLLHFFPRFAIFIKDICNMLRSIDDPNAPLPAQKASTEVDFRARPVPSEENSDEDDVMNRSQGFIPTTNETTHPVAIQGPDTRIGASSSMMDLSPQDHMSLPEQWSSDSYIGDSGYEVDFPSQFDQGLLWDWADALGTGFNA